MWFLIIEFIIMFIGLPLVVYLEIFRIPKLLVLSIITIYCVVILVRQRAFRSIEPTVSRKSYMKKIMRRFILLAIVMLLLTLVISPKTLFTLPRQRTALWLVIMFLYPLLSAFPQELIYRTFFFHRYASIFKSSILMIVMSVLTFSFVHIIYDNIPAIIFSLVGGYLFTRTYHESRSLLLVSFEHAIYGAFVFTVGLGHFFYEKF
ncbi:CPBP family intramembrane metalloprotease [candidate division KSB1 bacterium]|nr:CPBP family intramembrane metalloprotease [candidate division KSB1 bacterium]